MVVTSYSSDHWTMHVSLYLLHSLIILYWDHTKGKGEVIMKYKGEAHTSWWDNAHEIHLTDLQFIKCRGVHDVLCLFSSATICLYTASLEMVPWWRSTANLVCHMVVTMDIYHHPIILQLYQLPAHDISQCWASPCLSMWEGVFANPTQVTLNLQTAVIFYILPTLM